MTDVDTSYTEWCNDTVASLIAERDRLKAEVASLRITLGGKTFGADVPEPIGCPMPGACSQVAEIKRLRAQVATARGVKEGEVVVPIEPTEEQINAAIGRRSTRGEDLYRSIYCAMVGAAKVKVDE